MKLSSFIFSCSFLLSACLSGGGGDNSNIEIGGPTDITGEGPIDIPDKNIPEGKETSVDVNINCEIEFFLDESCADVRWIIGPNDEGGNAFLIQFSKRSGQLIDPKYQVGARAISIDDGSGNGGKVLTAQIRPVLDDQGAPIVGKFVAYGLNFEAGPWEMRVQHKDENGDLIEEHQLFEIINITP